MNFWKHAFSNYRYADVKIYFINQSKIMTQYCHEDSNKSAEDEDRTFAGPRVIEHDL